MGKTATKFKVPDVEKDRKLVIKESKRDLREMMEEKAPLNNLAELAEALKKEGFKETYLTADLERKAGILNVLVDKAVLRDGNLHVFWKRPFEILFTLGQGVIKNREWRA